jgi:hypothetical protein
MLHVGETRPFGGDHVLDRHLGTISLEDRMTVRVASLGNEVSQNEEVRHFARRDETHQIEGEVRPSGRRHVVVVVELRVRAVEVVLPDAAAQRRRTMRFNFELPACE